MSMATDITVITITATENGDLVSLSSLCSALLFSPQISPSKTV